MKKGMLYYNSLAGPVPLSERRLSALLERLYSIGYATEAVTCSSVDQLDSALDLSNKDLLLIYGGDGTIRSLLPQVIQSRVPVALLPAGTANVLARELEIPRDPLRAINVLKKGRRRTVFLGKGGDQYFHLMTGIGLDGYVIQQTNERLKKAMGRGAFWMAGLRSFWDYPLKPFEIELDGESLEATFAVVSNSKYYGGQLLIAPDANVSENCLDACIFTSTSRTRFFRYLFGALRGEHVHYPDVVYRKVSGVKVHGNGNLPVQMDGDLVGGPPMELTSYAPGIEVIVPAQD